MENKLFRKSALDKISSPEQLNEYLKVAGAGVWWLMAGLALTFAAFFVWGVMGSIPETVNISGTALAPENTPLSVYCYLSVNETKNLERGMNVRVSPIYAPPEQYGYILGTIKSIGLTPITEERLQERLGEDAELVSMPSGNVIEVIVELQTQDDGNLKWSTPKGASVDVLVGSTCALTVITAEHKPYQLMFR
ncbi:MAG: hypothetical protein FWH20_09685 [Oscillospiraceae bacterium]|nr:hypothetical protein [Oscillospiraceae bacterium]